MLSGLSADAQIPLYPCDDICCSSLFLITLCIVVKEQYDNFDENVFNVREKYLKTFKCAFILSCFYKTCCGGNIILRVVLFSD